MSLNERALLAEERRAGLAAALEEWWLSVETALDALSVPSDGVLDLGVYAEAKLTSLLEATVRDADGTEIDQVGLVPSLCELGLGEEDPFHSEGIDSQEVFETVARWMADRWSQRAAKPFRAVVRIRDEAITDRPCWDLHVRAWCADPGWD